MRARVASGPTESTDLDIDCKAKSPGIHSISVLFQLFRQSWARKRSTIGRGSGPRRRTCRSGCSRHRPCSPPSCCSYCPARAALQNTTRVESGAGGKGKRKLCEVVLSAGASTAARVTIFFKNANHTDGGHAGPGACIKTTQECLAMTMRESSRAWSRERHLSLVPRSS